MAYVLRGRKGGTVRFIPLENGVIEKESESYSSSVTSNPVEDGADIDDHVNNAAGTLNISGTIIGGDGAINALKSMRDRRDVITYIGVTRMNNLVFTSLKFDRSYKNRHGASFSATLKQVQITSSEFVPMDAELAMTSQDAGKSQNPHGYGNFGYPVRKLHRCGGAEVRKCIGRQRRSAHADHRRL